MFLSDEKEIIGNYQEKLNKKKENIKDLKMLKGEELFNYFSLDEKIKNIRIGKKGRNKNHFYQLTIDLQIIHQNLHNKILR